MMKWFWKWVHKKVENSLEVGREQDPKYSNILAPSASRADQSLNFEMMNAEGGFVLRQNWYDPVKDRHNSKMYIISENEDVAVRVGEIVQLAILRM
jgi:hypothetical protein